MRAVSIARVAGTKVKSSNKCLAKWRVSEFYVREKTNGTYAWARVSRVPLFLKGHELYCEWAPPSLVRLAKEYADSLGISFISGLRSGLIIEPSPIEMLAITNRKY